MPTDFFCIRMYSNNGSTPKKLSQKPEAKLSPVRQSYGVNCKENAYGKIKPPQPKYT